jgi:hypothetical protein
LTDRNDTSERRRQATDSPNTSEGLLKPAQFLRNIGVTFIEAKTAAGIRKTEEEINDFTEDSCTSETRSPVLAKDSPGSVNLYNRTVDSVVRIALYL